jgi:membrane protein DedA with SNARE-associated domain
VITLERLAGTLADVVSRTGALAPAVLFLATFVEHVFPPFPGDLLVVLGAWYAVQGELSWPLTVLAVTAGAVAGAWVDWSIGRSLGRRLKHRAERKGPLSGERLARFEASYRRWGVLLLLANRFFPGVRAFIFLAAGASGIPLRTVLLFGGLSALLWNALLLGAGALLARNVEELLQLVDRVNRIGWVAAGILAILALGIVLWRRRAGRAAAEGR